jgi:hypothetical protein
MAPTGRQLHGRPMGRWEVLQIIAFPEGVGVDVLDQGSLDSAQSEVVGSARATTFPFDIAHLVPLRYLGGLIGGSVVHEDDLLKPA